MSAIAQALTAALLDFVWQGLLVAFLLWVALFALRGRAAQTRYLAALVALAVLAVLPVVTAVIEYAAPPSSVVVFENAAVVPADFVKLAVEQPAASGGWLASLESWALPVWSFGVLIFALRAVWGCGRISVMRRRAVPAAPEVLARVAEIGGRMGLTRPARVLMTAFAGSPSVVGWLRPVILLPPATLLGLAPEQLEAVLAHELAHIRRYDSLVNAAQVLVETLLFYHPAVWWTSARIREERELCCDDLAVGSCGDALCYARALTRLERLRLSAPALALGSAGGPLAYRIRRLMGAAGRYDSPSKLPGLLALALGLACLAANVHWARGQEEAVHQQTEPVRDTQEKREMVIQNPTQPARAELEALRQRIRELEAQLNDRELLDLRASEKAQAQMAEGAARQEGRLAEQKSTMEIQLQNLRLMLARLRRTYKEDFPEVEALEQRIAEMESSIIASEYESTYAPEARKRLAEMQSQLNSSRQTLESEQELAQRRLNEALTVQRLAEAQRQLIVSKQALTNWTVKSIDIVGLSGEARDALLANLPVKLGSKLAEGSVDAIAAALKKFDEHLTFTVTLSGSGEAVIHIARPKI
jgi:beta-lactamase regulating signal transducer with metallopeptidase domain/BMFP domain-containing protein YqiC